MLHTTPGDRAARPTQVSPPPIPHSAPQSLAELAAAKRQTAPPPLPARNVAPIIAYQGTPQTIAELVAQQSSYRQAAREFCRALPSWLSSFVVHLAVVLLLSMLVIPVQTREFVNVLLCQWNSLADVESTHVAVVHLQTAAQLPMRPVEKEHPSDNADPVQPPPQVAPMPDQVASEPDAATPAVGTPVSFSPAAQPVPNAAPGLTTKLSPGKSEPQTQKEDQASSQAELDRIVDRFIEYDLGRLPVSECPEARDNFDRLDKRALPALIRGLNKSARIPASCPVMVIAQRIRKMMRETHDPTALRYAVENIGRDVPKSAAHYKHLETLKAMISNTSTLAVKLRDRGISVSERLELKAQAFTQYPASKLMQSMQSKDQETRLLATIEMACREALLDHDLRPQLGLLATNLLADPNGRVREAAHALLVQMNRGEDLGPGENPSQFELIAAIGDWRNHWATEDLDRRTRQAGILLDRGQALEKQGAVNAARTRYREVINLDPGPTLLDEATRRLDALR